jgi:hypothetical protein
MNGLRCIACVSLTPCNLDMMQLDPGQRHLVGCMTCIVAWARIPDPTPPRAPPNTLKHAPACLGTCLLALTVTHHYPLSQGGNLVVLLHALHARQPLHWAASTALFSSWRS